MTLAHIVHHLGDHVRAEGGGIDLAIAHNAIVSDELDEDEVAPAEMRWRIADNPGFDVCNLHGSRSCLEDDDIAQGFAPAHTVDGFVDLVQRIAAGDQLIELQAALLIHVHQAGNVHAHLG